jgi:hypothetical protein
MCQEEYFDVRNGIAGGKMSSVTKHLMIFVF